MVGWGIEKSMGKEVLMLHFEAKNKKDIDYRR